MPGVDAGVPKRTRVCNCYLGGKHNFAADREAGDRALEAYPDKERRQQPAGRRSHLRHLRLGGRLRHDLALERQDLEMTGRAAANTCRGLSPERPGGTAITPPADSLNALICRWSTIGPVLCCRVHDMIWVWNRSRDRPRRGSASWRA